jgi:nitrite reductase/ring-hydroxylating ferredoxin subunit
MARNERWRRDFPVDWESDHYVTRRELAKFLTLGSALIAAASAALAVAGRWLGARRTAVAARIDGASAVPPGGSLLFRYPTEEDPAILVRSADGSLRAYSQVCTHLSCAVVHRPEEGSLFCPCHRGSFSVAEGLPTAGPPTRRLPRILVEQRGDAIYAVGKEV